MTDAALEVAPDWQFELWKAQARTRAKAEAEANGKPRQIAATPFEIVPPSSIPPRQWLYGKHYMRGMVSSTAGIGGAGKSSLLIVECLSMAIGRDLLNKGEPLPTGPLRVWNFNGEDPYEELQRRYAAAIQRYGITQENLADRLRVTSGRDNPILIAQALSDGGKVYAPTGDGALLVEELIEERIDAFVADPFVTLHRISENDNVLIDSLMGTLRDASHEARSAVELAHHLRKLNGQEASVDDIRGASSIIGACRSVRIIAPMSGEEAAKYGIEDAERRRFFWMQNGKANMLPPTHARHWYRMESVDLGNAQDPYPSDQIGVVESWDAPDTRYDLTGPELRAIRQAITAAPTPLNTLRYDVRSTGWVGRLIANCLELDISDTTVRNNITGLIERWIKAGRLAVREVRDPKQGRAVRVISWVDSETDYD